MILPNGSAEARHFRMLGCKMLMLVITMYRTPWSRHSAA